LVGQPLPAPRSLSSGSGGVRIGVTSVPPAELALSFGASSTTWVSVASSLCWYDLSSVAVSLQPPAAATSLTGIPFRSVAPGRRHGGQRPPSSLPSPARP